MGKSTLDKIRSRSAIKRVLFIAGVLLFLGGNFYAYSVAQDWMSCSSLTFCILFPIIVSSGIAMLLFLVCDEPGGLLRILTWRPLVFVGTISYSLYLYHVLIQIALWKINQLTFIPEFHLPGFIYGVIFLPPVLLLSAGMYYLFERPCLRWAQLFRS